MKSLGCFFLLALHFGYLTVNAGNHDGNLQHLCHDYVCQNDGKCAVVTNHHEQVAYCECKHGFVGRHCEAHDVNLQHLCHDFVCYNDGICAVVTNHHEQVAYCECKHGFVGRHCEAPSCHDIQCQNGGKCHEHQVHHTYTEASCTCQDGYTGARCEIVHEHVHVHVPAKTASPSTVSTSAVSTTTVSTTTLHTLRTDPCSSTPCTRHGTCKVHPNGMDFTCHCKAGYHGHLCDRNACNTTNPHCGTGTCVLKHTHPYYTCICPNGYLGHHCELTVCDTGVCNNGSCQVSDILPYFSCQCGNDLTGTFCEVPVTTVPTSTVPTPITSAATLQPLTVNVCHQYKPYCGNGTCVTHDAPPYYRCVCNSGYIGPHCEHNVCDINTCKNGSCQLLDTMPYFSCQCNSGYTGILCEAPVTAVPTSTVPTPITSAATLQSLTVNVCHQNKPHCGNGTCVTLDAPPYYRCVCNSGYIGPHCEHNVCDINPCNHGICQPLDVMPYFSCQCNSGYTGILCEGVLNPTSTPAVSVSSTPTSSKDFRACDKFRILTDVVDGVSTENNITTCQSGSHASPEAFVINNCNVTSLTAAWKSGFQVMNACHGVTALPTYSAVGIFLNGSYLDSRNGGTAGVFLGCLADGGFKLGVQDCDSAPVIKHINGSYFTMDPSVYFSIV